MPARHHVLLYTKPECHLCDIARGWLDECAADPATFAPFDLTETDIRRDEAIFAAYRYRIPVLLVDGVIAAEGRMDDAARFSLERALRRME